MRTIKLILAVGLLGSIFACEKESESPSVIQQKDTVYVYSSDTVYIESESGNLYSSSDIEITTEEEADFLISTVGESVEFYYEIFVPGTDISVTNINQETIYLKSKHEIIYIKYAHNFGEELNYVNVNLHKGYGYSSLKGMHKFKE